MNIVPMSQLKYLILLSCISLLTACGQKGPLVVKDTLLDIDRAYPNKVKSVPETTHGAITPLTKTVKQKDLELRKEGYKS